MSNRPLFLSAVWPTDSSWNIFKVGSCHGQWRATKDAYEILAVVNDNPGNGDFGHTLDWFYESCKRDKRELIIREVWNKRLAAHLIERGFTCLNNDDWIKREFI